MPYDVYHSDQESKEKASKMIINLVLLFSEEIFETQYYSTQDIVSSIGGILATLNTMGGVLMMATVAIYILSFANVLKRKANFRVSLVSIKRILE